MVLRATGLSANTLSFFRLSAEFTLFCWQRRIRMVASDRYCCQVSRLMKQLLWILSVGSVLVIRLFCTNFYVIRRSPDVARCSWRRSARGPAVEQKLQYDHLSRNNQQSAAVYSSSHYPNIKTCNKASRKVKVLHKLVAVVVEVSMTLALIGAVNRYR